MNFDAYLLAASPPVNFGMNYFKNGGLSFQKFGSSIMPYGCKGEPCAVIEDDDCNLNKTISNLKDDSYRRSRWSADMSNIRVNDSNTQGSFRDLSPALRTRKTGCVYRTNGDIISSNSLQILRSCLRSSSPNSHCSENDQILHEEENLNNGFNDCNGKVRKKVSFADDIRRRLFIVKIFEEQPDVPTYIDTSRAVNNSLKNNGIVRNDLCNKNQSSAHRRCKSSPLLPTECNTDSEKFDSSSSSSSSSSPSSLSSLSSLSSPSSSDEEEESGAKGSEGRGSEGKSSGKCLLIPNFSMPAANYSTFRQKIEDNCVSLETACQMESTGDLWGTVKVKELSYEKRVYLRVTFDSWKSHSDVEAQYVTPSDSACQGRPLPYATFSFRIDQPSDILKLSREGVQFAVCYTASGREYWDNNQGANYEFLAPDWAAPGFKTALRGGGLETLDRRNATTETVYSATTSGDWGSYASWSELDSAVPYW